MMNKPVLIIEWCRKDGVPYAECEEFGRVEWTAKQFVQHALVVQGWDAEELDRLLGQAISNHPGD